MHANLTACDKKGMPKTSLCHTGSNTCYLYKEEIAHFIVTFEFTE
jgi:hypothetical protein